MRWILLGVISALGVPIESTVQYIHPVVTQKFNLASRDGRGLEPAFLARKLSDVAMIQYEDYLQKALPVELEKDPKFRAWYDKEDAGRDNHGFTLWQKRAFALKNSLPVNELDMGMGGPFPGYHKEVSYNFDALYNLPEYKTLVSRIEKFTRQYLRHVYPKKAEIPKDYRTFVWAEVFRQNDAKRPHVHPGAVVAGTFLAALGTNAKSTLYFDDVRGVNAPFGRTHEGDLKEGDIILYPSWVSHFITPNLDPTYRVEYSFAVYTYDGPGEFDPEDDSTAEMVQTKKVQLDPVTLKEVKAATSAGSKARASAGQGKKKKKGRRLDDEEL
mmetsp:Transcript_56641/g.130171  ORF Transcript_56641/g.130171 Transcript_56641/m.130171 type:complete len:328 (-) Transcript_56641:100-1083(-)